MAARDASRRPSIASPSSRLPTGFPRRNALPVRASGDLIPALVDFIEPPQDDVIEKILRNCGLWRSSTSRPPPDGDGLVHEPDGFSHDQTPPPDEPGELTYVDIDTFLATF